MMESIFSKDVNWNPAALVRIIVSAVTFLVCSLDLKFSITIFLNFEKSYFNEQHQCLLSKERLKGSSLGSDYLQVAFFCY